MMSWEYGLVLAAIIAFFAEAVYRHPQLRRHAVAIPATEFTSLGAI